MTLKQIFCWHDWRPWKYGENRWASMFSIFAMPGSEAYDTVLVERYKNRTCKKCGRYQLRKLGNMLERQR